VKASARFAAIFSRSGIARNRAGRAAQPAASLSADGSGAPSPRLAGLLGTAALAFVAVLVLGLSFASASSKRQHLSSFAAGTGPAALAVDQSGGDVYVVDPADQAVRRFDAAGNPAPFSALGASNAINGSDAGPDADTVEDGSPSVGFSLDAGSQVAVDSSGGPSDGAIYVADAGNGVIDVFASSGAYLTQLTGSGTPQTTFSYPCGLATGPGGTLYVATAFDGVISRFNPSGPSATDADYDTQIEGLPFLTCDLGADSTGAVYSIPSAFGSAGALTKYAASDFGTSAPAGTQIDANATAVAVDATSDDVFVDHGNEVVSYDSSGASLGAPSGSAQLTSSRGLAINHGTDTIYASQDSEVHIFGPPVTVPDLTAGSASTIGATTATLNGTVDPDGVALTDCQFEYSDKPGYIGAGSVPCSPAAGSIPTGSGAVPVSAEITGLDPGSVYHFRLRATNANDTTVGDDAPFTTTSAPAVQTLFAGHLSQTTATLAGAVNPRNQAGVTYHFEWGTDATYGNTAPATPVALGASDDTFHIVTVPISGLSPDTTYHFRIVATNTATAEVMEGPDHGLRTLAPHPPQPPCANATLRTGASATLSECRAYERVSPLAKNDLDTEPWGRRSAAPSGGRVAFFTHGAAPGAQSGRPTAFLGRRGSTGWVSRPIDAPSASAGFPVPSYESLSPDLTGGILLSYAALASGAQTDAGQLYIRDDLDGSLGLTSPYRVLTPFAPQNFFVEPTVGGSTDGFDRVMYEADVPQTGDPVTGQLNTYLWHDGTTHLAGVLPGGSPPPDGSRPGSGINKGTVERSLSRDGRRVVFHAIDAATLGSGESRASVGGQLYVREDDFLGSPVTKHVSASQRTPPDPSGPLPALYWSAEAQHGSSVLFTSCEKLTDDSTASLAIGNQPQTCTTGSSLDAGPLFLGGHDLYLYDVDSGDLKDLTTLDPRGAKVFGVVGASEDLTRIYFVAGGVLDPGSGAQIDEPNLYLWENGTIKFIAVLNADVAPLGERPATDGDAWAVRPADKLQEVRVSPDGRYLLLASHQRLTGYDNRNPQACPSWLITGGNDGIPGTDDDVRGNTAGRCTELYLYDAATSSMRCVSCRPDGLPPLSNASLYRPAGGGVGGSPDPSPANLSPDGDHAYFETADSLVSGDTNGAVDVYQWNRGSVDLISSGRSPSDSHFAEATPSGDDVFFLTREKLVNSDPDALIDLYDARVDGGFAEPPVATPCEGESCRAPQVAPQELTKPGSAVAQTDGNVPRGERSRISGIRALSSSDRSALAEGKTARLKLNVNRSGTVTVTGTARIGKRSRRVVSATAEAKSTGSLSVPLVLSSSALSELNGKGSLAVRLTVRFGDARPKAVSFTLDAAGSKKGGAR
jgi:hypothetical protein